MQSRNINLAIIKTLCYAQIFSYPLKVSELWKYLIYRKKISPDEFSLHLSSNRELFEFSQEYIFIPGDKKLVNERKKRIRESKKKFKKALLVSAILSYIPFIKLIAVSGSLAMHNAKKEDDIDLFIITKKNRLWTTRFLVNIVLLLLKEKRGRKERYAMDKICPNMFISEDSLEIKNHNLYTAHEIAQLKVLLSKDNAYQKFLSKNSWVLKFLPNSFSVAKIQNEVLPYKRFVYDFSFIERILYALQKVYMKKRVTHEVIRQDMAAFHPKKHKEAILDLYELKVKAQKRLLTRPKEARRFSLRVVN